MRHALLRETSKDFLEVACSTVSKVVTIRRASELSELRDDLYEPS